MRDRSHKATLVVPGVTADRAANVDTIERLAGRAVSAGADLVLLPEAVLTGLANNDDPSRDLPLGEPMPGPATEHFGTFCARHDVWLGLGLLERERDTLYDSAVLLGPDGAVHLHYRRMQPQWHGRQADPAVYREGTELTSAVTPFGGVGFLVCGDLFDDDIAARFGSLQADWMLFPLARCFSDGSLCQTRWDREELPEYAGRVQMTGTPALMVNYLADSSLGGDNSFGGAWVISAAGEVLAQHPLGEEGVLVVDLHGWPGGSGRGLQSRPASRGQARRDG